MQNEKSHVPKCYTHSMRNDYICAYVRKHFHQSKVSCLQRAEWRAAAHLILVLWFKCSQSKALCAKSCFNIFRCRSKVSQKHLDLVTLTWWPWLGDLDLCATQRNKSSFPKNHTSVFSYKCSAQTTTAEYVWCTLSKSVSGSILDKDGRKSMSQFLSFWCFVWF